MNRFLQYAVFVAGLAAVCWAGAGYAGANPLALVITLLIGVFYIVGALELHRFQQATTALTQAVSELNGPPPSLGAWLEQLPASLRNAVRLRVEGERVGLPGPALTPYLAGLLVLLGMLGTFLGMVVTLKGTGLALESASDLQAIRASLSAPVKGLGLAFGTSVAGVAASAMLGLASALCRRDRLQAGQLLDTKIGGVLRVFSLMHQREESFRLLQGQAQAMPELVDRLHAMMVAIERQTAALSDRLVSNQDQFHGKAEAAYAGLAASVGESLRQSLTDSARAAGATIQPVVEATMAGIARETASLHDTIAHTVERQLDGLSARFEATTTGVAETWKGALAEHQRTSQALSGDIRASHDQFAQTFAQRSGALVDSVSARLDGTVGSLAQTWGAALAEHRRVSEQLSGDTQQALSTAAASFGDHAASLLRTVDQAHGQLQTDMAARDEQRLSAWAASLATMAASLKDEWQRTGADTVARQQQLCDTLAQTVREISARTEAHAQSTMAETGRLLQAAAEAPRAAAEVVAELRQKLSDSMARDNAMLEERSRILETLATLLDAVNHASTAQRTAVDALVGSSADLLERVGSRFTERVEAQTGRLEDVAAQVTGSAVEVASLGEAFGFAVKLFSESNDKLAAHLQRIEGALGKSLARSDDQLAYYVAQARELIDLSIMSQKQIVEDLQQIGSRQPAAAGQRRMMREDVDAGLEPSVPVWAVFGDLMTGLLGAFVLILVYVVGMQLDLATRLEAEVQKTQQEARRRQQLEEALAGPLAAGRVTLVNGRIGISGSVLFAVSSADLQPEGRQLLKTLAAPLSAYLKARDDILMVSGFTDDRQMRGGSRQFADNWELSAQRALTVTRALIEEGMPASSVFAAAFGAEQAVASNADAEGRAKNRRVEMAPTPRPSNGSSNPRPANNAAALDALRSRDGPRFDPVRFRFIEAMARRAGSYEGEARRLLDERLGALLAAYGADLERAAPAEAAPTPVPGPSAIAELVELIASHAPPAPDTARPAELKTLKYFRSTWSKLSADRRLTQSLAKLPENAGPLNSHQLVHRALLLMRELSPDYLNRFMAHVDTLLWLDQVNAAGPAPAAARGESPKKAGRTKAAS